MSRQLLKIINNDRTIIDLRMQSEDLINNADRTSEKEFADQAAQIKEEIEKRIAELNAEAERE